MPKKSLKEGRTRVAASYGPGHGPPIPKSLLADINRLKSKLTSLEKNNSSMWKEFKNATRSHAEMLKKQESLIAQLGKKTAKKEKRKPSEYNLFLKDKMSQGMSMVDAVKA